MSEYDDKKIPIITEYGLLMGFITTPTQRQREYVDVHRDFFEDYREKLLGYVNYTDGTISDYLYQPELYYTLGKFDLLSLSFIDDFHLGSFAFRPLSPHGGTDKEKYAFQYQIVNGLKIAYHKREEGNYLSLLDIAQISSDIKNHKFLGVVKLKVNSGILIGSEVSASEIEMPNLILRKIKAYVCKKLEEVGNCHAFMMTDSFSWHEFTLLLFDNQPKNIHDSIDEIRALSIEGFYNDLSDKSIVSNTDYKQYKDELPRYDKKNEETNHIFVDSQTVFNVRLEEFEKGVNAFDVDSDDLVSQSYIRLKTGHLMPFKKALESTKLKYKRDELSVAMGINDLRINFDDVHDLIHFCKCLYDNQDGKCKVLTKHIRSIESAILRKYPEGGAYKDTECCTAFTGHITDKFVYDRKYISDVHKLAQRLNLPKNVSQRIVGTFTNYTEIIRDESLYVYYIELYPVLSLIEGYLRYILNPQDIEGDFIQEDNNYKLRNISYLSGVLQELLDLFQLAYQNRFQESKRFGDNSDLKIEFNGGVHQIISIYDLIYKIVYSGIHKASNQQNIMPLMPIAVFGNTTSGIKATTKNVSINYFHLFQPEFYLTTLIKESCNNFLDQIWLGKDENELVEAMKKIRKVSSQELSALPITDKEKYFPYISPEMIETRINYFITYWFQYKFLYQCQYADDEMETLPDEVDNADENELALYTDKDSIEDFTFWFWHHFLQHSNMYNIDYSLRVRPFRLSLITYQMILHMESRLDSGDIHSSEACKKFKEIVPCTDIVHMVDKCWKDCYDAIQRINSLEHSPDRSCLQYLCDTIKEIANDIVIKATTINEDTTEEELRGIAHFNQVMSISKSHLKKVKQEMIACRIRQGEPYSTILRDKGIVIKGQHGAFFDSMGGIFITDEAFRKFYFGMRVELFAKLQQISYSYLSDFIKMINEEQGK